MPFFYFLWKNINSHLKKRSFSKKNTTLSCRYFFKITATLSNTLCSHIIFVNFFIKNPCSHSNIWSKNVNYVKTKLYYRTKKSRGCPFCLFVMENLCSDAHILSKIRPFSQKIFNSSPWSDAQNHLSAVKARGQPAASLYPRLGQAPTRGKAKPAIRTRALPLTSVNPRLRRRTNLRQA